MSKFSLVRSKRKGAKGNAEQESKKKWWTEKWSLQLLCSLGEYNWSKNAFVKDKEKDNAAIKMWVSDSMGENVCETERKAYT